MNDEAKPSHLLTMTNIENFGILIVHCISIKITKSFLPEENTAKRCLFGSAVESIVLILILVSVRIGKYLPRGVEG